MLKRTRAHGIWEHKCPQNKCHRPVMVDEILEKSYLEVEGTKIIINYCPFCAQDLYDEILMYLLYKGDSTRK